MTPDADHLLACIEGLPEPFDERRLYQRSLLPEDAFRAAVSELLALGKVYRCEDRLLPTLPLISEE